MTQLSHHHHSNPIPSKHLFLLKQIPFMKPHIFLLFSRLPLANIVSIRKTTLNWSPMSMIEECYNLGIVKPLTAPKEDFHGPTGGSLLWPTTFSLKVNIINSMWTMLTMANNNTSFWPRKAFLHFHNLSLVFCHWNTYWEGHLVRTLLQHKSFIIHLDLLLISYFIKLFHPKREPLILGFKLVMFKKPSHLGWSNTH